MGRWRWQFVGQTSAFSARNRPWVGWKHPMESWKHPMKSPRHPMDRPNRPTDRCKGASTCTTQQPMRPAAALPRSTPSPAIGCCRPPAPDTRATTPPHGGWTPLGPILWAHSSRGCAALTRGYRVVRPLRGRQPHHQLCSGTADSEARGDMRTRSAAGDEAQGGMRPHSATGSETQRGMRPYKGRTNL